MTQWVATSERRQASAGRQQGVATYVGWLQIMLLKVWKKKYITMAFFLIYRLSCLINRRVWHLAALCLLCQGSGESRLVCLSVWVLQGLVCPLWRQIFAASSHSLCFVPVPLMRCWPHQGQTWSQGCVWPRPPWSQCCCPQSTHKVGRLPSSSTCYSPSRLSSSSSSSSPRLCPLLVSHDGNLMLHCPLDASQHLHTELNVLTKTK